MNLKLSCQPFKNRKIFVAQLLREPRSKAKTLKSLFLFISVLFLAACQTAPKDYSKTKQGYWEAKALIINKNENTKNIVYLKFNAIKNKKLRLDVKMPSGYHIASLAMDGKKLSYIVPRKKIYYSGKIRTRAMASSLGVAISPRRLYNILFDTPIASKAWTCKRASDSLVESCRQLRGGTEVVWKERLGKKRNIEIKNRNVEVRMSFQKYSKKLEGRKSLFYIKNP